MGNFKTQRPLVSGLNLSGNVKDIKAINVGENQHLLSVKNNDYVQQIKIN
jgi:hypothetical protein